MCQQLRVSEAFGRYQLLKKLATGGMAEIWLARQQGMEGFSKLLVIKRILPHLAENEEFINMFLDEARIAARLNHANVVQIFDLGAQGEHYFIAMEYLHGEDARRVWRQAERQSKPLPIALACRIVMDACAGLDYAHKKTDDAGKPLNIVHRDVSPQNIIVTFEGSVKVVDFGIAKAADQSSVTKSGVVKGKYSYMSPEQASGARNIDHRTDQFALGIVLYELVTGERLFKRGSDLETLRAVEKCQVMPPSQVNSRVPLTLDAVILRALQKDPDQRYKDCQAMQLALEDWLLQNRLPNSSAQLASFLAEIYSERLEEERKLGHPIWDEQPDPNASLPGVREDPGSSPNTAAAKPKSISLAGSRPRSLGMNSGPFAMAVGAPDPIPSVPPKPAPPVASSPSLRAQATTDPPSLRRGTVDAPSVRRPTHDAPSIRRPGVEPANNLAVDDGATFAEQNTVSETNGSKSNSISREQARGQARRSLWVGVGAGGLVVLLGMIGLALLTSKPQPVSPPPADTHGTTSVDPAAVAKIATLTFTSKPSFAHIFVDGQELGQAPITASYPLGRTLRLEARLDGYLTDSRTYAVEKTGTVGFELGKEKEKETPLTPSGTTTGGAVTRPEPSKAFIVLESPMPLAVTLDGKQVHLPLQEAINLKSHVVTAAYLHLDYSRRFELQPRAGERLAPKLTPGVGKLLVTIKNQGYADVYVGGVAHGQVPEPPFELAEGEHTLTLKNAELGKIKTVKVNITAGQTTTVPVDLDAD
ncbi:MAG: serine/threonine protein kinase [Deltaproteobacteria bacterium]|nr:serine/threonine protein kinase [Deltaproteobacteria bacterium]